MTPSNSWAGEAAHHLKQVASIWGKDTICALIKDGSTKCLGLNEHTWGPPPPTTFVAIASSGHHCGITLEGGVECWGPTNLYGEASPPNDLTGTTGLAAGIHHTCAMDAESKIRCWGNSLNNRLVPPPIFSP